MFFSSFWYIICQKRSSITYRKWGLIFKSHVLGVLEYWPENFEFLPENHFGLTWVDVKAIKMFLEMSRICVYDHLWCWSRVWGHRNRRKLAAGEAFGRFSGQLAALLGETRCYNDSWDHILVIWRFWEAVVASVAVSDELGWRRRQIAVCTPNFWRWWLWVTRVFILSKQTLIVSVFTN